MKKENNKSDQQSQNELTLFKKFAEVCLFSINYGSIEKRKPPEPDIYCTAQDGSPIAFELSEIIDEKLARAILSGPNIAAKLKELQSREKYNKMATFTDAHISIKFYESAPTKSILKSAENFIDYLSTLPQVEGLFCLKKENFKRHVFQDDYLTIAVKQKNSLEEHMLRGMRSQSGDQLYYKPDENLADIVEWVRVVRGDLKGPIFNVVPHAAWSTLDLPEKRIATKFNREYKTTCNRIELLCYFELLPELPEDFWLTKVQHFVEANLKNSLFHRVWIYSVVWNKVIYVFPELTNGN